MFRNVLDSNVKVFRLFCVLAFLPLFVILALSILLFMYDALQIFHKPILRDTTFSTDMRVQDAGIIKHYDFDSILLGSSMLKNTLNSQANDILGGKWVNLSMGASLFAERSIVLKYALTHKNIKHIIYSVDGTYIPHYDVNTNNFDFLYTSSDEIKKLRIYFNKKFITCAITWSKDTNCVGEKHSLDGVNTWIDDSKNKFYLLYGGIQNWYKYIGVIKSHGLRQDLIKISKGIEPFIMPKVDFAKLDSINMDLRFVSADIRGGGGNTL
ncbi:hypothetical protein DCO58_07195 [Helicobacter saguini]|uniref:Uncharacterized protein n=1 Tax=Helicobacter saguini TaxID=1548018 RepID=A0A347VGF8_9HELI|nr:hypothetical protein [Helicobacter saguini]MWV61881.1 hypothetical protein [Helicobacter saguini]MWV67444.1 hypothetical protein [Helicobacter saguini]MWV72986.1 hypothetical protein [Helicobacter saguini]TLD95633.1 hypothetical protein LS64_001915 [Helicobacter saguini]